jgi:hypothetical protein
VNTPVQQTQRDLLAALRVLRLLVREVGGNYIASLQADTARVERAVASGKRPPAELRRMLQRINRLDIKPHRGRRRDLKQLDRLITKLSDTVENWT